MARDKKAQPAVPVRSGTVSGFRDAYKKAVTELLILRLLRDRDMYAYEMQREMERRSGGALSFNTLYLAIYRLKDLGFIEERGRALVDGRELLRHHGAGAGPFCGAGGGIPAALRRRGGHAAGDARGG